MEEEQEENKQLEALKRKIPYNEYKYSSYEEYLNMLQDLLNDAESIALSILYPFSNDEEELTLPKKYYNWQIRACINCMQQEEYLE